MVDVIRSGDALAHPSVERPIVRSIESSFRAANPTVDDVPDDFSNGDMSDDDTSSAVDRKWRDRATSREGVVAAQDGGISDVAPQREELHGGVLGNARSDDVNAELGRSRHDGGASENEAEGGGTEPGRHAAASGATTRSAAPTRLQIGEDRLSGSDSTVDEQTSFEFVEQRESRTSKVKEGRENALPNGDDGTTAPSVLERGRQMDEQRRHEPAQQRMQSWIEQREMLDAGDGAQGPREFVYRFESWGAGHTVRIVQDPRERDRFTLIPSSSFVGEQLDRRRQPLRKLSVERPLSSDGWLLADSPHGAPADTGDMEETT